MLYVIHSTNKLFLSGEAYVDLGIIPNKLPTMGEAKESKLWMSRDISSAI